MTIQFLNPFFGQQSNLTLTPAAPASDAPGAASGSLQSAALPAPIPHLTPSSTALPSALNPSTQSAVAQSQNLASGEAPAAHVTSNATNSLASSAAAPGGVAGAFPFGGFGGFAAIPGAVFFVPVIIPFGVGFPSAAPAPAPSAPAAPAPEVPVDAVVEEVTDALPTPDEAVVDVELPASDAEAELPATPPSVAPPAEDATDLELVESLPELPFSNLTQEDFAELRLKESDAQQESRLSLTLTTLEGDTIELNFQQLDFIRGTGFRGTTNDGEYLTDYDFDEGGERAVSFSVEGDISDAERAAIDAVLGSVLEAANEFFQGGVSDAAQTLRALSFDTAQLAELSLDLTSTRTLDVDRFSGAGSAPQLYERNASVDSTIEFFADTQRRLIEDARTALDDPSAAVLIRRLVPPLLSQPFEDLGSLLSQSASQEQTEDGDPQRLESASFDTFA